MPMYSFENHQRLETTTRIYSPHVLILEGIFALFDQRILDLLDMKIFAEADADLCLARRRKLKQLLSFDLLPLMSRQSKLFGMSRKGAGTRRDVSNNGFRL